MLSSYYFKLLLGTKLRDCTVKSTVLSSYVNFLNGSHCYHSNNILYTAKVESSNSSTEHKKENETTLNKEKAQALILKLTDKERHTLVESLKEFEALKRKEEYKGQLAAFRWRSKFGRPSKVPSLGDVDPTGSYCQLPEDWLLKKYGKKEIESTPEEAEIVPKPTSAQLMQAAIHNAIPFIGFGFLDNAIMILCGDYIELRLGAVMTMSTMAAAALGNTFSDILGLGSAFYVERLAAKVGIKPPDLTPIQLDMSSTKIASNLGRVVGVTIGCLLGMLPLLII